MFRVEKKFVLSLVVLLAAVSAVANASLTSKTVLSFGDPSGDAANPLFSIDFVNGVLTGGWDGEGLDLVLPQADVVYEDATFVIDNLNFTPGNPAGGYVTDVGPYAIRFFHDSVEVVTIEFDRLFIESRESGLNAQDAYGDNVKITGIEFGSLYDEQFGFTFVNTGTGDHSSGYQATASFIASAVPEPATLALLGLGGLALIRRKK